jgi:hypothetical protein
MMRFLDWLTKYEAVAVWIEGLALIGIFGFDIWVAGRDHEETLKQIDLAQKQIEASHNAERAWIMATLDWFEHGRQHVMYDTQGGNPGEGELETTEVTLKLNCANEGRSPAFITKISGYSERLDKLRDISKIEGHKFQTFSTIGPLGPGKEKHRSLLLICPGHAKHLKHIVSVYVVVEYTDIFGNERKTTLGYTVDPGGGVHRQDQFPDRNRNT